FIGGATYTYLIDPEDPESETIDQQCEWSGTFTVDIARATDLAASNTLFTKLAPERLVTCLSRPVTVTARPSATGVPVSKVKYSAPDGFPPDDAVDDSILGAGALLRLQDNNPDKDPGSGKLLIVDLDAPGRYYPSGALPFPVTSLSTRANFSEHVEFTQTEDKTPIRERCSAVLLWSVTLRVQAEPGAGNGPAVMSLVPLKDGDKPNDGANDNEVHIDRWISMATDLGPPIITAPQKVALSKAKAPNNFTLQGRNLFPGTTVALVGTDGAMAPATTVTSSDDTKLDVKIAVPAAFPTGAGYVLRVTGVDPTQHVDLPAEVKE
ncbi:MAG: hypothetical protein HY719_02705, partial [Planctomycetes bacterium]|nr:hypothetical protein [Planctomycetota bacterium]